MTEGREIDLIDILNKLWKNWRFILKSIIVGLILGIIVAFSLPKEYETTVILAPEVSPISNSSASALAAMAGINLGNTAHSGDIFSTPDLFPEILNSTPFILGLFEIKVKDFSNDIDTTLYSYIIDEQSVAWWDYVFGLPSKVIKIFKGSTEENGLEKEDKIISLSEEENAVLKNLKKRLDISVDKKTNIITLAVKMQNPEISAYIADTVTSYIQSYVTMYRTEKARQDLHFTEKLYQEARKDYYEAQRRYASFRDENINVTSARYKTTEEKLQNEYSLAYNTYNQMAQQLQMAKVKVQEVTPVYTVIQPSVVPLVAASPNKKLILITFVFLFFVIASCIVLVREPIKGIIIKLRK